MALSDDAVVDAMLAQLAPAFPADTVVIDHTTTSPAGTASRVPAAARQGIRFVHAPVFMSPQMCRDAVGLMLVAGPQPVFESVREPLQKMTGEVWYVGERPDLAAAYKIFGNSLLFVITAGIVDVLAMAKSVEVSPQDAAGVFSRFKVGSVVATRADKIARGDFAASFELTMARKDMRLMLEAAGNEPLVVLPAIARRMDEAIAEGHGKDDMGIIAALNASSHTGSR
jgi:3-hydroxyisobutyrate dehydrogenase-like beta-hydroxyacid dehydrogenase